MKKLTKDKKDSLILTVLGTGFYCVFALQFFVTGQNKRIENLKKQDLALEDKISNLNRLNSREALIVRDHDFSLAKLEELKQFTISGSDPYSWMLSRTEEYKQKYKDLTFNPNRPVVDETPIFPGFTYEVVRFKISGKGYFHDLGSFINDLENANPFFRVEKISLGQKNGVPPVSVDGLIEILDFSFDLVVVLNNPKGS